MEASPDPNELSFTRPSKMHQNKCQRQCIPKKHEEPTTQQVPYVLDNELSLISEKHPYLGGNFVECLHMILALAGKIIQITDSPSM